MCHSFESCCRMMMVSHFFCSARWHNLNIRSWTRTAVVFYKWGSKFSDSAKLNKLDFSALKWSLQWHVRDYLAMSQELAECFWPFQVCKWTETEKNTKKSQQTATSPTGKLPAFWSCLALTCMSVISELSAGCCFFLRYEAVSSDRSRFLYLFYSALGSRWKVQEIWGKTGCPLCGFHVFTH